MGKNTKYSERPNGDGTAQVCDLETGDCYTVSVKDGLIERFDNTKKVNRRVQVETPMGVKQLLNG